MKAAKQKTAWAVIFMAVAAVLIWKFGWGKKPTIPYEPEKSKQENSSQQIAPMTAVDESKLPDRFPAEIPLEKGAKVTLNYNAVNLADQFQSSREFISKYGEEKNFEFYKSELKKLGWEITQETNESQQKILMAKKGENELNIRIYSQGDEVRVSINNITSP